MCHRARVRFATARGGYKRLAVPKGFSRKINGSERRIVPDRGSRGRRGTVGARGRVCLGREAREGLLAARLGADRGGSRGPRKAVGRLAATEGVSRVRESRGSGILAGQEVSERLGADRGGSWFFANNFFKSSVVLLSQIVRQRD